MTPKYRSSAADAEPTERRVAHPGEESTPGVLLWGGSVVATLVIFLVQIPVGLYLGNVFNWLMQVAIVTVFAVPLVGGAISMFLDKFTKYRDRKTAALIFGVSGAVLGGLWGMVLADLFLRMVEQTINPGTLPIALGVALIFALTLGLAMGLGRLWADFMGERVVLASTLGIILFTVGLFGAFRTLFTGDSIF